MRLFKLFAGVLVVVLLAPAVARAHDLKTVVTIGPDVVKVEAGFDDDSPAEKARVTVTDTSGATVGGGVLDERGVWSFPRPAPGRYTVVVESAGHRDKVPIEVADAGPV